MSSVALGTRANGLVILDTAFGADATSAHARVDALEIEASLISTTLFVLRTFGIASGERITEEVGWARANGSVILSSKNDYAKNVHFKSLARRSFKKRLRFRTLTLQSA